MITATDSPECGADATSLAEAVSAQKRSIQKTELELHSERERHLEALAFQHRRADALLRLQGLSEHTHEVSFLQRGIAFAESLTGSALGFFCFVSQDQASLGTPVWSAETQRQTGQVILPDLDALTRDDAWAAALYRRAPITFDAEIKDAESLELPAFLTSCKRLIVALVNDGEVVRAILGLANKASAYQHQDIETVQLIADALWRVVSRQREQAARERQHRELAEARARAEDYAQAKSRFLAKMSHELRTPLNVILNLGQTSLEMARDERQRDYLRKTRRAARDLLALVNEILAFSKAESGRLRTSVRRFDLCELLSDTISILTSFAAGKALSAYCDTSPRLPRWLIGDRRYLKQVLSHLISNAVKFAGTGEVHLSIRATEADARRPRLLFCVQDSGPGLNDDQVAQLFRPFDQLDDGNAGFHPGLGLGLVLARHLVDLMGGELHVNSQPGVGSSFCFTLAFQCPDEAPLIDPAHIDPLRRERILVIAPSGSLRRYVVETLQAFELDAVTLAETLTDAMDRLNQARAAGEPLTLALVDADLALGTSPEHIAALRATLAPPTASGPTHLVVIAPRFDAPCPHQLLGAKDVWLEQPLSLCRLLSAMKDHLDQACQGAKPDLPELDHIEALVVDSDASAAQTSLAVLGALGIQASAADNAAAVLKRLPERPPDLMLIDLEHGNPGNRTLLEQVRDQPNCAHLIVIGLCSEDALRLGSSSAYADAMLVKPLTAETLRQRLQPWFSLPPSLPPVATTASLEQGTEMAAHHPEPAHDLDIQALERHLHRWRELLDEDIPAAREQGRALLERWREARIHAELHGIQALLEDFELEPAQQRIDTLLASVSDASGDCRGRWSG